MTGMINYKRYAVTYVAVMVGLMLLNIFLAFAFDYSVPTGVGTVLPAMMAALMEGQKLADSSVSQFTKGDAWRAAGKMTLIAFGINAVVMGFVMLNPAFAAALKPVPVVLLAAIFAALMVLTFFMSRFFVMMGFKSQRKAAAKRPGK